MLILIYYEKPQIDGFILRVITINMLFIVLNRLFKKFWPSDFKSFVNAYKYE